MVNKRVRDVLFQLLFLFVFVKAYRVKSRVQPSDLINRLLGSSKAHKPVILLIDRSRQSRASQSEDIYSVRNGEYVPDRDYEYADYVEKSDNGITHALYQLLENIKQDPSSSDQLSSDEVKKQVLRSALRTRCRKVESCVQQCPPKKPSCPKKCQQKLDDLQLCPPPDPCANKSSCQKGKTMPPYWRFM